MNYFPAMARPRVLMLIHKFTPFWGGADTQLRQLAPRLKSRGWEVEVLTRRWRGDLQKQEMVDGLPVRRLGVPGTNSCANLWFAASLARTLWSQPEPCIIQTFGSALLAALAGLVSSRRRHWTVSRVATPQRLPKLARSKVTKVVLRWLRRCDAAVAISSEIQRELEEAEVPVERIVRIPNGVDCERFSPCAPSDRARRRSELNLDPNGRVVVFCGRLAYEKGLDTLGNAWISIERAVADAWLLILGSSAGFQDPIEQQVRDRLQSSDARRVIFQGHTDRPEDYLAVSDVFVLPSRYEGLPNALLEAMATALPSVATRIPGVMDVMEDGVHGSLVPVDDVTQLADRIIALLSQPEVSARMGSAARSTVESAYAWNHIADVYDELYTRLISRPPGSGQTLTTTEGVAANCWR